MKLLSHVRLCATPWTLAHQVPPSMGFSSQEYWSGLPFSSPMGLILVGFISIILLFIFILSHVLSYVYLKSLRTVIDKGCICPQVTENPDVTDSIIRMFIIYLLCMHAQSLTHVRLFGLEPARLLSTWDLTRKNTEVGCHFLPQGIFPTQG